MKNNYTQKLGLAFTLVALFLASCGSNATFSKRYHNRGFNIAWGGGADASPSKPAPKKTKSPVAANEAVATQELQVADSSQSNFTAPLSPVTGASSTNIAVVPNHIIYVQPVAHAAKTSQIAKATLTSIGHRNADAKVMTQSKAVLKKQKKAAASGPGKSQIVALILCILVGPLGIHRFYLGYPLEGVLMLLTVGGCGIWWIIDLIRIVTGDLQPFDGEYTETL